MKSFKGFLAEQRVDTTLNASITELFPAIAFNLKYKPSSVEDFKKFLYTLNFNIKCFHYLHYLKENRRKKPIEN